ncbi:MAG: ORF6N domain-containing protein [Chitinophagaceae bacterium]|nr:ORF6N domain-containing protein [Chitinophagaceae bacterium]MCA6457192.1 ORF6N domain-containing protein [Chitinophagaceae bacterium]MCA6457903.1 ORF6N domain-containing protein [Chitinophagaceae bacterium]MCA6463616.1 ORF6N domain-containing protein [Chitinophagaceae bacterium]MEA3426998.1 ORF6N domain-containing protein [Bacteroidota bacterium]
METTIIQQKIYEIRGERVMLDFDLAILYAVETKVLNQAVKRNLARFPADFMFQLTQTEYNNLKSQIVTSSWGGVRKLPYAFTEHGVTMLAGILRSEKAIVMNITIVRAFIALRQMAMQYKELAEKLAQLENSNHQQFKEIYQALNYLIEQKQQEENFQKRQRIGFIK